MNFTQGYFFTQKENPTDAEISSHKLLVRAGYIKKVGPGLYTYGFLALRSIRKFEKIVREELEQRQCIEILMPMVHPQDLWEETGRYKEMGDGLLKFKNRNGQGFCLGATHEEVVTDYIRKDIKSYRDLPKNLYQIQSKYRDEIRPRFGLMRGREFIMKDAYSFDIDPESALKAYDIMYEAYQAIFNRLGLNYRIVEADAGNIGGSLTHEFQVLAEAGEDHLMVCNQCDYAANIEVAPAVTQFISSQFTNSEMPLEKFSTPGLRTIEALAKVTQIPAEYLVKTMFFSSIEPTLMNTNLTSDPDLSSNDAKGLLIKNMKPIVILLRGCDEVNPIKLKNHFGLVNPPLLLNEKEVQILTSAQPGSCGPVGLKIPIYADTAIANYKSFMVGANEDDYHYKNASPGRDFEIAKFADFRVAKEKDQCPKCEGKYQSFRGIEVGHVFYLGTKYSKLMNANYLDAKSQLIPIEMGCYGIGIGRTVQAAVEQSHDSDGICWPKSIAPFEVHICMLDPKDEKSQKICNAIEEQLKLNNYEALIDDRDERPGVKFKDADLMGMPLRINLGKRGIESGELEIVERKTKTVHKIPIDEASKWLLNWLNSK